MDFSHLRNVISPCESFKCVNGPPTLFSNIPHISFTGLITHSVRHTEEEEKEEGEPTVHGVSTVGSGNIIL